MAFDVEQFRSNMIYDGARSNLFEVQLRFPSFIVTDFNPASSIRFMANSTTLPQSSVGIARQSYFGREVKFPGDRVFADWSVNIINDETFALRDAFEAWLDAINSHSMIARDPRMVYNRGYSVDATVTQFGKAGLPIKNYTFVGLFPVNVDQITVSWAQNDTIEEFGVTFSYQYWESNSTT